MKGKHVKASPRRKEKGRMTASAAGDTKEFRLPPRRRRFFARYFFFTLFICLLMAAAVAAALSVDFRGRMVAEETDLSLAFAVSEEGKARLSLLGRNMEADLSFLAPVKGFFQKTGDFLRSRTPGTFRVIAEGIPRLYEWTVDRLSKGEQLVASQIKRWMDG